MTHARDEKSTQPQDLVKKPTQPQDLSDASRHFLQFENPGRGNCGFYSLAIGFIPYLQAELKKPEAERTLLNNLKQKMWENNITKLLNEELNEESFKIFVDSIATFNIRKPNPKLLDKFNDVFRKLLIAKRFSELKEMLKNNKEDSNNDFSNIRKMFFAYYSDEANKIYNTTDPIQRLDFYAYENLRYAIENIATEIKALEKKTTPVNLPSNETAQNQLVTSYLRLLATGGVEKNGYLTEVDKEGKLYLTEKGKKVLQEYFYNDATEDGLSCLKDYLNICQQVELKKENRTLFPDYPDQKDLNHKDLVKKKLNQEKLDLLRDLEGLFDSKLRKTPINEDNRFKNSPFISGKLEELTVDLRNFVSVVPTLVAECETSGKKYELANKFVTRIQKGDVILYVPNKLCKTILEYRLLQGLSFEDALKEWQEDPAKKPVLSEESLIAKSIKDKLDTAWATEKDISDIAAQLDVTAVIHRDGKVTQPGDKKEDKHPIHIRNLNNTHWDTLMDIFPNLEANTKIDKKILSFSRFMRGQDVTLDEIKALFTSYKNGGCQFFGSRHHLAQAESMIKSCAENKSIESIIMDLKNYLDKNKLKINHNGDFMLRVNYLLYRFDGALHLKPKTPLMTLNNDENHAHQIARFM